MRKYVAAFNSLIRDIAAWGSVVTGLIGWYAHVTDSHLVLSSSVWLTAAAALSLVAAFRAYCQLEQQKTRKSSPTVSLLTLVGRITDRPDLESYPFDPVNERMDGVYSAIGEALREIREQGHLNSITIWAREGEADRAHPRGIVPGSHWKEFQFDYLDFLRDKRGRSVGYKRQGFSDFWFDQNEIDVVWPSKRNRIRWRIPWAIEKA